VVGWQEQGSRGQSSGEAERGKQERRLGPDHISQSWSEDIEWKTPEISHW
jgi:hypothetical protein